MKILYIELLSYKQHVYFCAWLVSLFCFGFFYSTVALISFNPAMSAVHSLGSLSHPSSSILLWSDQRAKDYSRLSCLQDRNPTPGGWTQSWLQPLKVRTTQAFQEEPRGTGRNHTPGKCHRKGIYFMSYTRQDNQHLFRKATGPSLCERTATACPLNLLMHCAK